MFHDLNVQWAPKDPNLPRTLAFLHELDYKIVALNHTISGKLPSDLRCLIPDPLPFNIPPRIRLLRRCTLVLSDTSQNHRLSALGAAHDILAIRPMNEKAMQQACQNLDICLISLDMTIRHPFHFKQALVRSAINRGVRFEICYAPGILATDPAARRNLVSNATQLIRATRGRGIVLSSEASRTVGVRAPFDAINLGAVWGLSQEMGKEALEKQPQAVVAMADLRKSSWRGVIDVVDGGGPAQGSKRDRESTDGVQAGDSIEQPPLKKLAKEKIKEGKGRSKP